MPPQNPKNLGLTPAALDLGLGDALHQQVQDEVEQRKKLKGKAGQVDGLASAQGQAAMSPATMSLIGRMGGFHG